MLRLVGDRTGYPLDMLDPGLDLEADLSIDSIKRIEIIGELLDHIPGLDTDTTTVDDETIEELARIKTIDGIVTWLTDRLGPVHPRTGPSTPTQDAGTRDQLDDGEVAESGASTGGSTEIPPRAVRATLRWADAPADTATDLSDGLPTGPVAVAGRGPVADAVAALLAEQGAGPVVPIGPGDDLPDGVAVLVDVAPLTDGLRPVDLLARIKAAAASAIARVVVVHRVGDASARGLGGLLRAAHREQPATTWRSVGWTGTDDPSALAAAAVRELAPHRRTGRRPHRRRHPPPPHHRPLHPRPGAGRRSRSGRTTTVRWRC